MTINEKRQLSNYIKGLVREALGEVDMPDWHRNYYGVNDEDYFEDGSENDEIGDENEFWHESDRPESRRSRYEGPDVEDEPVWKDEKDEPVWKDEKEDEDPAGITSDKAAGLNELRMLAEAYARESVSRILSEKKGGWKKKSDKKKGSDKSGAKKENSDKSGAKKKSSGEKTLMDLLNSDAVNAAHYYYKLWPNKDKDSARGLGYKKAKGAKTPNKKGVYRFTSKERNKLYGMMTTDKQ